MAGQQETMIIAVVLLVTGYLYSTGKLKFLEDLLNNGGTGGPGGGSTPPVVPPSGGGGGSGADGPVLWDSNTDGGWNNGQKRTVSGTEGDQSPDGGGLYTAASGGPHLIIDGDGVAHLEAGTGHGRIYIKACNYNAMIEGEFMMETSNLDNFTFKLRNRHGMGGSCENRFGGVGAHIEPSSCGVKIEKCHNVHEQGTDKSLPKPVSVGQWVKVRFYVQDTADGGIGQKIEIDWNDGAGFIETLNTVFTNPQSFYMDKETFLRESEFWIRINNTGTASVAMKNIRLIDLGDGPATAGYAKSFLGTRSLRGRVSKSWANPAYKQAYFAKRSYYMTRALTTNNNNLDDEEGCYP